MTGMAALAPKEPKRVALSGSGGIAAVAAVSGKKIRVIAYVLSNTGAALTLVKFQSATNDLTGTIEIPAHGTIVGPWCPDGHVQTNASEALNITNSANQALGGYLVYVLI